MKTIFVAFCLLVSTELLAQKTVTIQLSSITPAVALQMKESGDRISWYSLDNNNTAINTTIELSNEGGKPSEKLYVSVKADPDESGNYKIDFKETLKIKKVNLSKPLSILVKIQTIFGNEVFANVVRDSVSLSNPIMLDGYLWRADNEKIKPERQLCIELSAFMDDAKLRDKLIEEGSNKFQASDFKVYLKQDEKADWKALTEPIKGTVSNGTRLSMTNTFPSWLNPNKKLFVRFSVKTVKGNFIWGEYIIEPHEYRKELRANNYSSAEFNSETKLN